MVIFMINSVGGNNGAVPQKSAPSNETQRIDSEIRKLQQQIKKLKDDETKPPEEKQKKIKELQDRIARLEERKMQAAQNEMKKDSLKKTNEVKGSDGMPKDGEEKIEEEMKKRLGIGMIIDELA